MSNDLEDDADRGAELGATKAANMVMLGALLECAGFASPDAAWRAVEATVKNVKLLEIDQRAIEAGPRYLRDRLPVMQS